MRIFRRAPRRSAPQNRARLTLEALDLRLPPSSLFGLLGEEPSPTSADRSGPDVYLVDPRPNAAPQIENFAAVEIAAGMWRFTGDVIDEAPGGLTVTLGGEPESLQGVTVTTDANGRFDIVLLLNTDGSDNGLATAQVVDGHGAQSNLAMYSISPG